MSVGELLNLFFAYFPYLEKGGNDTYPQGLLGRLDEIRQTKSFTPNKYSMNSSCCYHLIISRNPSRIVLSGSFFYGIQFPSLKEHLSSEPLALLLDEPRDSLV